MLGTSLETFSTGHLESVLSIGALPLESHRRDARLTQALATRGWDHKRPRPTVPLGQAVGEFYLEMTPGFYDPRLSSFPALNCELENLNGSPSPQESMLPVPLPGGKRNMHL